MTDSVEANLRRGLAGHPTADPVLEAVTKRIVQITRHYERAMREVTARHGISLGDAEVLFTLAHSESPHHTPGELARTFQITPGSMTTRLARLERAGYIERHIDPTNRVSIKVVLTPEGDQLHRQTVEDLIDLRRQLIADALPARELSKLNTLLNRILSHIERDHTPDPPIRPPAKSS
ncbi:MAG TPA: MarR family transcriptional regulator [Jatrophihabitantaceae bacterium]|nr:MarR family transcriptional regulator [Jatrophihabitantaceae bacterium]